MDQRKNSAYVAHAPASTWSTRRPRRRGRSGHPGLLLMAACIGVLGGLALTRGLAARGASTRVSATRADAAAAHPVVAHRIQPAAAPLAAARLVDAPFSWDYRWLESHPATGLPANRSRAALMVDLESGHVLFSRTPHQRLAQASTAKLMTAMVVLDNTDPSMEVIVPADATRVEPNVMGLTAGERVTVHDLLMGLLLDSGNDAAETLAMTTLNNRDTFVSSMNAKAAAMGLTDTHFANPTGLDDPGQFTSPNDLALTAAYLFRHYPVLDQVVTTREASIAGNDRHKAFDPINLNKLLWTYPGAIGFKTGLTDNAGTCLVAGAQRAGRTLLLVELNDPLIFTDASALMDYGFRHAG